MASAFSDSLINILSDKNAPLQIFPHPDDFEFLVPSSGTLAALLVEETSREKPDTLLAAFVQLGNALAPFVTRNAIRQHTAEARLAGRLFDADGVVEKLLGPHGDAFYDQTNDTWRWNSRYWEQRALYVLAKDPSLALQYARHAVSIERHPFPMTTLSKVLFLAAKDGGLMRRNNFSEALDLMRETLAIESRWERGKTKTAYWVLFDGVAAYLSSGEVMAEPQSSFVTRVVQEALREFGGGTEIRARALEIQALLQTK